MKNYKKQTVKSPTNRSDTQATNSTMESKEENNRWGMRSGDAHDFSSVIEEVGDSFGSGEDLLKEFEQYGIKIENVEVHDQPEDLRLRTGGSRFSNDLRLERGLSEIDTVLDYSNMAKIKERDVHKGETNARNAKLGKRIKFIGETVRSYKGALSEAKMQIQKNLKRVQQESRQQVEQFVKEVLKKIYSVRQQQQAQLKRLNQKIESLEFKLNQTQKQKCQLYDRNKVLAEEIKSLKVSTDRSNESHHQKQSTLLRPKFGGNELDFVSQSRKFANDLELEYRKESQVLKTLNVQIQQLTKQVSDLKSQNKDLKTKLREAQKKLSEKQKPSPNLQNYTKFLQKIKQLEQEINFMKQKQSQEKSNQVEIWREEIRNQLEEIDQFLAVCEEREKDLERREREVQRREADRDRKHRQYYEEDEMDGSIRKQSRVYAPRSPVKTSSTRMRISTQPNHPYSQKLVKYSSPSSYDLYSRPSLAQKTESHEPNRPSLHRQQSRYTDSLNTRLNRISSCIENELNSLGCYN